MVDAPYAPGNRGLWRKSKCLNRQELVVVGWTDPEGSRPHLGALLLGYYTDDGNSPVTMSLFDHGISGAMMTSIAVSPSMAKMTGTASVESD